MVEFAGKWTELDLNVYRFGFGTISVVAVHEFDDGTEISMLMIEEGLGSGEIGGDVPARIPLSAVYPVAGSTLLVFDNLASLDVVMAKLWELREVLEKREGSRNV